MRKKIILLIIVLLVIAVLTNFMPFPARINTTISGIRWANNDSEFIENVEIEIKGIYLQYLFRDNVFVGDISFTGLNRDIYTELMKITFFEDISCSGSLAYYSKTGNSIKYLGDIRIKGAFDKVVIYLFGEEEFGITECYISAPASDRQAAVDIASALYGAGWVFS